jgi:hypothetical protein
MSRRTYRRGRHPAVVILAGTVVLVAADLAVRALYAAGRSLPLLLALAAIIAAYRLGRRRALPPSRPPKLIQGRAEDSEVIRLRAEAAALRAERGQARESARGAGEASGPKAQAPRTARDRLLSDRLSGVHDLFGGDR